MILFGDEPRVGARASHQPWADRWNPVGIRTAAAMKMHGGAEANVVDAGGPEIGPPVSAANPNGIEIIQPRVARYGLPWENVINRHQL